MDDKKFGKDLTVGSIPKHLLSFSMPILLANMLQSGYSFINMIWVGNIVGENGLGAIAVSLPVMFILIGLAAGLTMATSVLVSQFYGAKNYERLRHVVDTSFAICIIIYESLRPAISYLRCFSFRAVLSTQQVKPW
jgi:Na+-driven multidrug efflux pump